MKKILIVTVIAFAWFSTSCSKKNSRLTTSSLKPNDTNSLVSNPATPTAECPSGLSVTVTPANPPAGGYAINQDIVFNVAASGCSYGYVLNSGLSAGSRFSSSTTYSKRYTTPGSNLTDSVDVTVLNAAGQAARSFTFTSAPFTVASSVTVAGCTVSPLTYTVPVLVNSAQEPLITTPPQYTFSVTSSVAVKVKEVYGPEANYVSTATTLPTSSFSTSSSVIVRFLIGKAGTLRFKVVDSNANEAECTAAVSIQPTTGSVVPAGYFKGEVTGDSYPDIVTRDTQSGDFWVAKGLGNNSYQYVLFGTLPAAETYSMYFVDLNQDAKMDLLLYNAVSREWKAAFSTGSAFTFASLGTWPADKVLQDITIEQIQGHPAVTGKLNGVNYVSTLNIAASAFAGSISAPVVQEATVDMSATPASVAYQGSTILTFTSQNANACTMTAGTCTPALASGISAGSCQTPALTATTTYRITCNKVGQSGTVFKDVSITVAAAPVPTADARVRSSGTDSAPELTVVDSGGLAWLRWTSANVSSCSMKYTEVGGSELTYSNYPSTEAHTLAVMPSALNRYYIPLTLTKNTTFQLRCLGYNGAAANSDVRSVLIAADVNKTTPVALNFNSINENENSPTQAFVVKAAPDRGPATGLKLALPAKFKVASSTCPSTLLAGATCQFNIMYSPGAVPVNTSPVATGTVKIEYNDGIREVSKASVTVTGTGVDTDKN